MIDYRAQGSDWRPSGRRVILEFDGDSYQVSNELSFRRREYELPIPTLGHFDRDALRGIFLSSSLNPGLLSLPYAVLADGTEDIRISWFDPRELADPAYQPGQRVGNDVTIGPIDPESPPIPRFPSLYDRRPIHPQFDRRTITFEGFDSIQLGPATRDAHRVRLGNRRDWWIAPDGTVLRRDTQTRFGKAWIGLLRPSEY